MGSPVLAARLTNGGSLPDLVLKPALDNGRTIFLKDLDLGFPSIREDVNENAAEHGTQDFTSLYGSKVVSMELLVPGNINSSYVTQQILRPWMSPRLRPVLVYTLEDGIEREMTLRVGNYSDPMPMNVLRNGSIVVQTQWTCPAGISYTSTSTEIWMARSQTDPGIGVDMPMGFGTTYPLPIDFPEQLTANPSAVVVGGSETAHTIIRIFGPCTSPRIESESQGKVLAFVGFNVDASDYIEIDLNNKTVQLNGVPGAAANRRGNMTIREWWSLTPGTNLIRFTCGGALAPNVALLIIKDAWL